MSDSAGRGALRIYGLALCAFPAAFRRRFGPEMTAALDQDLTLRRMLGSSPAALARITGRACLDAIRQGISERFERAGLLPSRRSGGPVPPLPPAPRTVLTMLDSVAQDVRFAIRTLARTRLFTAVVVLTLTLGIGATTVVFSAVNAIVLKPLPYPEPERLVMLWEPSVDDPTQSGAVSPVDLADWVSANRSFEALGGMRGWRATLTGVDEPQSLAAYRVSTGVLEALRARPLRGRLFTPEEDGNPAARAVLLTEPLWRTVFAADETLVGDSIRLNDEDWVVAGVLPAGFEIPRTRDVALIANLDVDPSAYSRGSRILRALGRLAPGVEIEAARADMERIAARLREEHPDSNRDVAVSLVPLHEEVLDGIDRQLWLLLGAVGFVLLITVVNVANLMIARAATRRYEIAIRTALGAGRARIGRQLLTESFLLALLGGLGGVTAAIYGLRGLLAMAPESIPRLSEVMFDGGVLAFAILVTAAVGLAFGATPWIAARRGTADALRGSRGGADRAGMRLRQVLVALQVAIALVLLIGSGLLLNSLARLLAEDPGFEPAGIYASRVRLGQRYADVSSQERFFADLVKRLERRPEIAEATAAFLPPFSGGGVWGSFDILAGAPEGIEDPSAALHAVAPGFVEMLEVPVLAGRTFDERDVAGAEPVAMVTAATARAYWPGSSPVGEMVRVRVTLDDQDSEPTRRIIGVVGDLVHRRLDEQPREFILLPAAQYPTRAMYVLVRPLDEGVALAPVLRATIDEIDPEVAITEVTSLAEMIGSTVASDRFAATLISAFALIALALGCVGIYGVVAYAVSQRRGEFGVRLALGARAVDIGNLVLRDTAIVALAGLAIGLLTAGLLGGVLQGMLHEVEPTDPLTFAGMSALLLLAAVVAAAVPARRAARTDPLVSLRDS